MFKITKPDMPFDNLVVAKFNRGVVEAAQEVIDNPAVFNPFCFCSEAGSGKSLLLQTVANVIKNRDTQTNVHKTTGIDLAFELMKAKEENRFEEYLESAAEWEYLIVDDIEIFSKMVGAQEMFLKLVYRLEAVQVQMIFSCNCSVPGFEAFCEKLQGCSDMIRINKPGRKSRQKILRIRAREYGVSVSKKLIRTLAKVFDDYSIKKMVAETDRILDEIATTDKPILLVLPSKDSGRLVRTIKKQGGIHK